MTARTVIDKDKTHKPSGSRWLRRGRGPRSTETGSGALRIRRATGDAHLCGSHGARNGLAAISVVAGKSGRSDMACGWRGGVYQMACRAWRVARGNNAVCSRREARSTFRGVGDVSTVRCKARAVSVSVKARSGESCCTWCTLWIVGVR